VAGDGQGLRRDGVREGGGMSEQLDRLRALLPEGTLSATKDYMAYFRDRGFPANTCIGGHAVVRQDKADAAIDELATIAADALEASNTSVCVFCGETMARDLPVMLEHAKGCEKRPENRLMAERDRLRRELDVAINELATHGICSIPMADVCPGGCDECWATEVSRRADHA
jgi:hypothetical protein